MSEARFKVACCGRRFGKSTMAARDLEPELMIPRRWYWIVGPTYDLGEKEFRVIWDDLIVKQQLGKDKRVRKAYNKKSGDMYIEFPWRTRVEVRSAEHPENLVGEGLHGVIMSEAAKHRSDTWERYIRAALADYRGWATFPTTPEGQNWLYKLWQFGINPAMPEYQSWRFPSWENPFVYPGGVEDEEIKLIRATTSDDWFQQEIVADFTAFVGKIYGEFQEDVHVRPHTFNPMWPNYIAFDWGYSHPLAAIEFQIDPWDNVYVWREHYKSYLTLGEHLKQLREREQPPGYHLDMAFGDAADPAAAVTVSEELVGCLAMPEAKENVRQGIDLVKTFLKLRKVDEIDEYGTPLEMPRLTVAHQCPNTIREFNNYRAQQMTRNTLNPRDPKDGPQKHDDHAMDAIRYGLMHIFVLGCRHHLDEVWTAPPKFSQPKDDLGLLVPNNGGAGFFTTSKEF